MEATVNKDLAAGKLEVIREFKAPLAFVWKAWTDPQLLDQWWAPHPWRCETKSMDFEVGGKWIYEMVGPNGERHGALQIFGEIEHHHFYSGKDAFADAEGNINEQLPVATWRNTFQATPNGTRVTIVAQYPTPEALSTVLEMGMEEGLKQAQRGLDELLGKMKVVA